PTTRQYSAFGGAPPLPFFCKKGILGRKRPRSGGGVLSVYFPAGRPAPFRRAPAFGAITVQLPQDRQSLCRRVVECKTATGRDGANPRNEGSSKTKRWRVTMRGVAVPYAVLAAVLVLNAAVAQNDPGHPLSPYSPSAQTQEQADVDADEDITPAVWQAPVGHRQPSAKDVPPKVDEDLGIRSPEDEAIDRKLRICRDC